jgi:hypothetical protein
MFKIKQDTRYQSKWDVYYTNNAGQTKQVHTSTTKYDANEWVRRAAYPYGCD